MEKLLFQCLASGSSGNCYYLGTVSKGILIDAGIHARQIRKQLRLIGLDFSNIWGVFVTHDHADHIRAVGSLGEKHHIPIYTTCKVHEGIDRNYSVSEKLLTCRKYIEINVPIEVAELRITAFPISHDSTECVGYYIEFEDKHFMIATDVGCTSPQLAELIQKTNYLVVEANYDEQLLLNGPYPSYLKSRIISDKGHMSNDTCGKLIAENYRPCLHNVFLCHLSKDNNLPTLAYDTVNRYLQNSGIQVGTDLELTTLARLEPSKLYRF